MTATSTSQELTATKPQRDRFARAVEYSVAVLLTAVAVVMHVRYFLYTGGLWRDEITSINVANIKPLSEALANLYNDSFPAAWLLTIRFWQRIGIGTSDAGLRLLGLLVGMAILAVLWRNAKRFGLRTPVISVVLLSFTSAVICYGDSIRAYGLGMFLALAAMGCIWEFTQTPTPRVFIAALLAAMLSVHMLFYNSVLLFAFCCGAFVVMLPKRQWKQMGLLLVIGMICATSLLVYRPMIRATRDYKMFQIPLSFGELIFQAQRSVQFINDGNVSPGFNAALWQLTIATGIIAFLAARRFGSLKQLSTRRRDAAIYCAVVLAVGVTAYGAFLKILHYRLEPWYFLAAIAMVACCLDGLLGVIASPLWRVILAIYAVLFALNALVPVWGNVGTRRTSVDLIAHQLEGLAKKGDVIVAAPWEQGVTLYHYYHGPAEVVSIPPVSTLYFQQYKLLTKFLHDRQAMDPLISKLGEVLRSGHTVWVVGEHRFTTDPPAKRYFQELPDPNFGWLTSNYQVSWTDEVFYPVRRDSETMILMPPTTDRAISHYEQSSLTRFQGFHDHSVSTTRP